MEAETHLNQERDRTAILKACTAVEDLGTAQGLGPLWGGCRSVRVRAQGRGCACLCSAGEDAKLEAAEAHSNHHSVVAVSSGPPSLFVTRRLIRLGGPLGGPLRSSRHSSCHSEGGVEQRGGRGVGDLLRDALLVRPESLGD
eukprot:1663031-Rhodomonas_salina.3